MKKYRIAIRTVSTETDIRSINFTHPDSINELSTNLGLPMIA